MKNFLVHISLIGLISITLCFSNHHLQIITGYSNIVHSLSVFENQILDDQNNLISKNHLCRILIINPSLNNIKYNIIAKAKYLKYGHNHFTLDNKVYEEKILRQSLRYNQFSET